MASGRPVRYSEKIYKKQRRHKIILYAFFVALFCIIIRFLLIQTWRVQDDLLNPSLRAGDIVLVSPYFMRINAQPASLLGSPRPGDIVLVSDGIELIVPNIFIAQDAILRFFTFQRFSMIHQKFGDDFGRFSFHRINAIERTTNSSEGKVIYQLESDDFPEGTKTISEQYVQSSRLAGKVLFRLWPISSLGIVR